MPSIRKTWFLVLMVMASPGLPASGQEETWRQHADAGREAHQRGDYPEAERWLRLALSEVERLGKDAPETADVLIDLADLLGELPKFAEAEALAKRALKTRETAFGRNDLRVCVPLHSLAMIVRQQGRFAEAEPLLRRAVAVAETWPDADLTTSASPSKVSESFSWTCARIRRPRGSTSASWRLYEKAYGPDDDHVARTLNNLAIIAHGRTGLARPNAITADRSRSSRSRWGRTIRWSPPACTTSASS